MTLPPNVRRFRGGFRAVISIEGRRYHGKVRRLAAEAAADVERLRADLAPVATDHVTMRHLQRILLEDVAARGLTAATRTYYVNHWRMLIAHGFGEDLPVSLITPVMVERYAAKRKAAGVSDSTIWRKELQVLDRACRILIRDGRLTASPVARARQPRIRSVRFGVLTRERIAECVDRLRTAVPPQGQRRDLTVRARQRQAAIVELLFLTGLRRAELARLTIGDVDTDAMRIFVRGKTGDRYIPMSETVEGLIRALLGPRKRDASCKVTGGVRALERAFAAIQAATGEPLLTPHVLRHSFATDMVRRGVQPFVLSALLGHSDPRQTARYFHLDGVDHRSAMDSMSLDYGVRRSSTRDAQ